jgi:hypothetical protein
MTFSLKHTFTSPKADGTDATLVQPSNWNAEHTITLAAGKVLGRDASGAGAVQELPLSFDATGQSMVPPSGTTAQRPSSATAGMLRYNTSFSKFELYNGTTWGAVGGGATISDTAPTSPQAGDLWWKSDEGQMYVYYTDANSSQWVVANAFGGNAGYLPLAGGALSGSLTGTDATFSSTVAMGSSFKRNRIINGNMLIDQRNAGASITGNSGAYPVDRWATLTTQSSKLTCQQSTTVPTGFKNSVLYTSSSAYAVTSSDYFSIFQRIEGYNVSDLNFGTATATTVTLSFWVRCSLTGIFGGACHNNAFNRVYPFTYTISAANTWEYKTITIAGDTSGTWLTDNQVGLEIGFSLGCGSAGLGTPGAWATATNIFGATGQVNLVGTSGATFYITGVQLEVGTKATPYEMQIYSDQLAQCQRYYEGGSGINSANGIYSFNAFKVTKRAVPTLVVSGYSGSIIAGPAADVYAMNVCLNTTSGLAWTASAEL